MWIDLRLLVHKVNATLKKEVEEIPTFLVKRRAKSVANVNVLAFQSQTASSISS